VAKKALMLAVVAFAVFFLLTRPEGAADAVQSGGEMVGDVFHQIARFFSALVD